MGVSVIERILFLIEKNNITAKKLTADLELSNSAITEWKKGKGRPSIDAIIKISKYFNVTSDWLLTGETPLSNISVSGSVSGSNTIVGSTQNSVIIGNGQERYLSSEATELLNIYESLDPRKRHKIFDLALKLENEMEGDNK